MPALEELGQYLVDQGLATAIFTDLYLGQAPPKPPNLIVIYPTGGVPPVRTFGSGVGSPLVSRPSFQVMVRNTKYLTARNNAQAVWEAFDNLAEVTLQGTSGSVTTQARYLHVTCDQSEPVPIQPDNDTRHRFVINISVLKKASVPV